METILDLCQCKHQNLPGEGDAMMIYFDGGIGSINGPGSDTQHEWELLLDE